MEFPWLLTVLVVALALTAIALVVVLTRAGAGSRGDVGPRLDTISAQNERLERELRSELAQARAEAAHSAKTTREELGANLGRFAQTLQQQLATLTQSNEQRLEAVRTTVEQRLELLRSDNAQKLEQMRATVDERLQSTLDQRLGESFRLVSERLEQVHKGLGEMQTLAAGVGDLKRVLTNVKTRGGWGEVQLGALLEEMLAPGQFAKNVATRPGQDARVEYAVKFPGRNDDGVPCWLPIDAKFPLEDYQRLQDAIERADVASVELSRKSLEDFFKAEARKIRDKYVEPPHTTDFAILFIPTEGLYAEALSRPGLADVLQRDFRVMLSGPSSLMAFLNSLQLGFRSLAIEKRSTEVWRVLAAVKTEFDKFGELLAKTKDRLDAVAKTLDEAGRKSTTIARRLREVEALPEAEADRLLTGPGGVIYDSEIDLEPPPAVPDHD